MHPHAGKKVLWVDDDISTLELGRIILEPAGYHFVAAQDGQEALGRAEEERPDLILLDYSMSSMSGREVFDALAGVEDAALRHTPVVMLTGRSGNNREQRELLARGLAAYLVKPFGPRELLNVIDNVLVANDIRAQNRQLETELRDTFTSVVQSLISLLSVKDPYTGEHSGALLVLAEKVARRIGLPEEEVFDVKIAALLHDIGKIGVPEAILRKPGRLTPEEKAEMDKHVAHGYRALAGIPKLQRVRELVLGHHEWWDGRGYPRGLVGEETPMGARIVAVVDAYDAMTSDRPYRRGMESGIAVERLRQASGTQFDPFVVESFTECLSDGVIGERDVSLQGLVNSI
jgi:putative two-component system response regulator